MRQRSPYTKMELALRTGHTTKRLTKELLILEPEILEQFPHYRRNCQILGAKLFKYLLQQLTALEQNDILDIMKFRTGLKNYGFYGPGILDEINRNI